MMSFLKRFYINEHLQLRLQFLISDDGQLKVQHVNNWPYMFISHTRFGPFRKPLQHFTMNQWFMRKSVCRWNLCDNG